jgi:hypothetical protein
MKTLLAVLALSIVSNAAMADGFAPWAMRATQPHAIIEAPVKLAPIGFAPWRELMPPADIIDTTAHFGAIGASAFRPWHMPS